MRHFFRFLPAPILQSLTYGSAIAITKGFGFLLIPFLTHYLEPADYGRLDILQTLADLLTIVLACGLGDCLFRYAAKDNKELISSLYNISLIITISSIIITQLAAPILLSLLPGDITLLQFRLILLTICFSPSILIPLSWLRLEGHAFKFFKLNVGRTFAQATAVIILLSMGYGLTGVLVGGCLVTIIAFISLFFIMKKNDVTLFRIYRFKKYFHYGSPLILVGLSGFILGSFDRLILANAVGPAEMAIYALAAKFALVTALLVQPFDMWWTPIRFKTLKEENGKHKCAQMIRFGIYYTLLMAAGVTSIAPILLTIVVPESYHGAIQYIPYLSGLMAIHLSTNILNLGCYAGKTTKAPMIIDMISAAIALTGYLTLIPIFEIMGAVYATSIALSFRLITTIIVSQKSHLLPLRLFILLPSLIPLSLFIVFSSNINSELFTVITGSLLGLISIAIAIHHKVIDLPTQWKNFVVTKVRKLVST